MTMLLSKPIAINSLGTKRASQVMFAHGMNRIHLEGNSRIGMAISGLAAMALAVVFLKLWDEPVRRRLTRLTTSRSAINGTM
jgi:hypothetical protein